MPRDPDDPARAHALAKEQSLTELEQAIGDREQLVGDREQSRIDQEQLNHDDRRNDDATSDHSEDRILDDRQARIDREQLTRDVRQESLDHGQEGRDNQQHALDKTRAMLNLPTSQQPDAASASAIRRGATERARATRERAEAALIRAQATMTRAEAVEIRAHMDNPSLSSRAELAPVHAQAARESHEEGPPSVHRRSRRSIDTCRAPQLDGAGPKNAESPITKLSRGRTWKQPVGLWGPSPPPLIPHSHKSRRHGRQDRDYRHGRISGAFGVWPPAPAFAQDRASASVPLLANPGSPASDAASPAFVLARAFS